MGRIGEHDVKDIERLRHLRRMAMFSAIRSSSLVLKLEWLKRVRMCDEGIYRIARGR